MRVGFFLREAMRSMSRNAVPSFAAMASVLVTVLVLGMFIPVVQATTGAANDVRGRVLVNVYLKTTAKPGDVDRVRGVLDSASRLAIFPMQDLFGWRARINTPAQVDEENWTWRLPWPVDQLVDEPEAAARARQLAEWTAAAGR